MVIRHKQIKKETSRHKRKYASSHLAMRMKMKMEIKKNEITQNEKKTKQ